MTTGDRHLGTVTRVVNALGQGPIGEESRDVMELVYAELRRIAQRELDREFDPSPHQATAIVNEAMVRLTPPGGAKPPWESRRHFYGAAMVAMRRILVDAARNRRAERRYQTLVRPPAEGDSKELVLDVLDLDAALHALREYDPELEQLVGLRFFVGLRVQEVAETMGISKSNVKRRWKFARGWLYRRITGSQPDGADRRDGPGADAGADPPPERPDGR